MNIVNPQIYIMTFFAFGISAAGWGTLLYFIGEKNKKFAWIAVMMLPFSLLVNLAVKGPLNQWIVGAFDISPGFSIQQPFWYIVFLAFLPPLTEELIKAFPLVFPQVRNLTLRDGLWVGAWSGLGFGLGEILYLAWRISMAEQYQGSPWFVFTGFLGERIAVCLIHAILTAILFNLISRGRGWRGYGLAVLLHFCVNIGAILLSLKVVQPWFATASLAVMLIILVVFFEKYRKQWENEAIDSGITKEIVYYQRNQSQNKG